MNAAFQLVHREQAGEGTKYLPFLNLKGASRLELRRTASKPVRNAYVNKYKLKIISNLEVFIQLPR